ncbi:riboflavin synthase [candidate division KSB1 bacterium]|nr:riboflavin synthase [candidate division KSB1 bacterium]
MFTGLVEETGTIQSLEKKGDGYLIIIKACYVLDDLNIGDSIAVNGVCLTVVEKDGNSFSVEAVEETIQRSALARLTVNQPVNLERALKANSRLGGHFVQGHVDGIGEVISLQKKAPGYWLNIKVSQELLKYLVPKGSIAVNGTSLTIADIDGEIVSIAIIPHTAQATTITNLKTGTKVNIEADILGKYIYKFLHPNTKSKELDIERLNQLGFN